MNITRFLEITSNNKTNKQNNKKDVVLQTSVIPRLTYFNALFA